ncbi:MAG: hypothetical protein UGF89_13560 [Acutalibacteraceae bacterium]|nr:hypothetical protein [Acutalibacteraceae bacterium]
MNRAQTRALKAIIKKKVPKEDRDKVLEAIDSLDMDQIINNPAAIADLLKDPSKLSEFVKKDEVDGAEGESAESSETDTEDKAEKDDTTSDADLPLLCDVGEGECDFTAE